MIKLNVSSSFCFIKRIWSNFEERKKKKQFYWELFSNYVFPIKFTIELRSTHVNKIEISGPIFNEIETERDTLIFKNLQK